MDQKKKSALIIQRNLLMVSTALFLVVSIGLTGIVTTQSDEIISLKGSLKTSQLMDSLNRVYIEDCNKMNKTLNQTLIDASY